MDIESLILALAILALGGGYGYARQYYKKREKLYRVSKQFIRGITLNIVVFQPKGGDKQLIVHLHSGRSGFKMEQLGIEIFDRRRERLLTGAEELGFALDWPKQLPPKTVYRSEVPLEKFAILFRRQFPKAVSFRFFLVNDKQFKLKTHELALNSKNNLYRPDSGWFN